MNADFILRVVWPIHDDAMYDGEAIYQASQEWPGMAEAKQVTVIGAPSIRVIELDPSQQQHLDARRAVVCEAPVIRRISTVLERTAA